MKTESATSTAVQNRKRISYPSVSHQHSALIQSKISQRWQSRSAQRFGLEDPERAGLSPITRTQPRNP